MFQMPAQAGKNRAKREKFCTLPKPKWERHSQQFKLSKAGQTATASLQFIKSGRVLQS